MRLIYVSSDWHGDAVTDGVRRLEEVRGAAMEFAQAAIDDVADMVVFLGDLCDPHTVRSHAAIALMHEIDARLDSHGIERIYVTGNHDVIEDGSGDSTLMSLDAGDRRQVYKAPTILSRGGETTLVFLPYTAASHGYDPAAWLEKTGFDFSGCVAVLGHLNLPGITPGSESKQLARGREVVWPLAALRKLCPRATLVGGHYHKGQEYDGVHIVGSLARLTHGEEGTEPSYLVLNAAPGGRYAVERRLITNARRVVTIGAAHPVWREGVAAFAELEDGDALVRLIPPHDAAEAAVELVEGFLKARGMTTRSGPADPAPAPALADETLFDLTAKAPDAGDLRGAVQAELDAATLRDRPATTKCVESALTAAGL